MTSISAGTTNSIIVMDYDGCGDSLVSVINLYNLIYNRDKNHLPCLSFKS